MSSKIVLLSSLLALTVAAPTNNIAKASKTEVRGGTSYFKRDSSATVTGAAAVTYINNYDGIGAGSEVYNYYSGDGSTGNGWPSKSHWVSFADMFNNNKPSMFAGCAKWGVAANSGPEVGAIYDAIQAVAQQSQVDHRLILAIIMTESSGCVRAPTSYGPYKNPGLMQDFEGYYTCNHGNGDVDDPCSSNTIHEMVREGAVGTDTGDGLASLLNKVTSQGCYDAQCFYEAACLYHSGSIPSDGDLSAGSNYVSDVANRLTGWTN